MKKILFPLAIAIILMLRGSEKRWTIPDFAKKYEPYIKAAEAKYDLPPTLLARLLWQESRYREDVISGATVSSAGAVGIAQIVPRWHPGIDPLDVPAAIDYAGKYLKQMFNRYGSWHKALAAYNWGPGNLDKAIQRNPDGWLALAPGETQDYVREIVEDVTV